jgi:CRP-like cAMP-binding protein
VVLGFPIVGRVEVVLKLDPSAFVADRELLNALESRSTSILCDRDRVLFNQGETPGGLYVLRAGSATLSMTSHAGEVLLSVAVPAGALLGLPGFVGGQPYSLTAKACKGSELGFVSREAFSDLMLNNPALSLKLLSVLAAEVRTARNAISEA